VGPGCESLTNVGNPNRYIKTQCLAFPSPTNLRGNLGRNAVIGPGLSNLDISLFKNNRIRRISENFNVQFRAEFFNALNHPQFANPDANFTSPTFGVISATAVNPRVVQLALKLEF